MSSSHFYRNELLRKSDEEENFEICPNGYIKRFGKPARRERDCPYNCEKGEHCEEQQSKAYWRGQKWNGR